MCLHLLLELLHFPVVMLPNLEEPTSLKGMPTPNPPPCKIIWSQPPPGGASSKKRSASPTPVKTSSKRIKGTPAKKPVHLKDAVVRANFETFTERFEVCQKMTTYNNPKKVKNNPEFLPVAETINQVVEKPEDEHADMNNMWRELPL
jgi:hypothetical protein